MISNSIAQAVEQIRGPADEQIHRYTDTNIAYFTANPGEIDHRLRELDREWDIDRVMETGVAGLSILGAVMGILGRRRWLLLPVVAQGLFLQHALEGSSPPEAMLRRMGVRSRAEIEAERYALKAIKGDFRDLEDQGGVSCDARAKRVLEAIRRGPRGEAGELRNVGDEGNRRPMHSENMGPVGEDVEGSLQDDEDDELPRSDVGPTS